MQVVQRCEVDGPLETRFGRTAFVVASRGIRCAASIGLTACGTIEQSEGRNGGTNCSRCCAVRRDSPALAQTPPKQAVLDTTAGTIVMDLLADTRAQSRGALHQDRGVGRLRRHDVLPDDQVRDHPGRRSGDEGCRRRARKYGTGGLNLLKPEITDEKQTRGAVSATQIPGKADSAGTQFFICGVRPARRSTASTRSSRASSKACSSAQKISETAVDDKGLAVDRIVVNKVTIRDKPAETPEPFSTEPVEELARYRAVLDTSMGEITLSFTPDKAPNARAQLPAAGAGRRLRRHELSPRREGIRDPVGPPADAAAPLGETQQKYVRQMKAEFNDQLHDKGTLSMARLADPDSASASFFIVTARAAGARRQVLGVRQGRERPGRGREDRGGGA